MIKRFLTRHKTKGGLNGGFTLAELIVVIAIFAMITAITLFDQSKLDSNVLLSNIAFESGLAVREAQVYGLGVKNNGDADQASAFVGEYGAHFDTTEGSNRQVIVYANTNAVTGTRRYDAGEEKSVYEFTNQRGNKIEYICLGGLTDAGGNALSCDSHAATLRNDIDIVFRRPEPAPVFFSSNAADSSGGVGPAYIVLSTLDGSNCKVVVVNPTGQISVETADKGHCTPVN